MFNGFLILSFFSAVLAAGPNYNYYHAAHPVFYSEDAFAAWAAKHGKTYTAEEKAHRYGVWKDNFKLAEKLEFESKGEALFGSSAFADLEYNEFAAIYLGTRYRGDSIKRVATVAPLGNASDIPDSFDWRSSQNRRVGPVKKQGHCGSCWAFATVAHLEGLYSRDSEFAALSEQELVDCDRYCDERQCDKGCAGGMMNNAMAYVLDHGISKEAAYPYIGRTKECKKSNVSSDDSVAFSPKFKAVNILPINEDAIKQACFEDGPIPVAVHVDIGWQLYRTGIYDISLCSRNPKKMNHGVTIVGWGRKQTNGKAYWIIRNSWGETWGEAGYIRLAYGKNKCGVANEATRLV